MPETVKIYIPTPTKKGGVIEVDARPREHDPGSYDRVSGYGYFFSFFVDEGWFLDKAKAIAAAEAARLKRLGSLKKQIENLEKIGPFECEER